MAKNDETKKLDELIESLSKKKVVLTEDALKAKQEYDNFKEEWGDLSSISVSRDNNEIIDEFNDNVRILNTLFKRFKFEEFLIFLAKPARLFVLHLMAGVFWGLGLGIGIVIIVLLILFGIR